MALPVWVTWLANLRGPEGPPISQAQIDATVQSFLPDAVADELQSTGGGRLSDLGVLVSSTATVKDLNLLPPASGWVRALSTALNRPPVLSAYSVLHLAYSATNAAQIAITVGASVEPAMFFRACRSDVWDAWVKLTTPTDLAGALDARVAGLVAELDLVTLVKCVHLEAGVWVWDGPDAPAATHYLLPDDTGALVARPTPFPTPLATPALDW